MRTRLLQASQGAWTRSSRRYVTGISWTLGSTVLAAAIRVLVFILVAQVLGPEQLGVFVATRAVVGFVLPLSGWGFADLVTRNVSRDKSVFSVWWGNGLVMTVASGGVFGVLISPIGERLIPGAGLAIFLILSVTYLVLMNLITMTIVAFRARWRMTIAAFPGVLAELSTLLAAVAFSTSSSVHDALRWAVWQAIALVIAMACTVTLAMVLFGKPRPSLTVMVNNLQAGTHFALADASFAIRRNLDLVLLSRFAPLEAVGIYSAAVTIVSMTYLVPDSLGTTLLPRYFQLSGQSVGMVMRFARNNAIASVVYGVMAGAVLLLGAPVISELLGPDYANSVEAIRWLSLSPVLFAVTKTATMTLTALDRPQDRTKAILVTTGIYAILALWLMPRYSWQGAIVASLVSEALLAVAMWGTVVYWHRRGHLDSEAQHR